PACGDYQTISAIKYFVGINCTGKNFSSSDPDNQLLVGPLMRDKPTRATDILDGTSQTIMVAEDAARTDMYRTANIKYSNSPKEKEGGWADPNGAFSIDGSNSDGSVPGPCPLNCSNDSEMFSFHPSGANVVFCDGSVHFLSASIDLCQLAALATRAGG